MERRLFSMITALTLLGAGPALLSGTAAKAQHASAAKVTEMSLGAEDAPITVIEYASFTCSHCATFHEEVYKDLKTNYIDTGKVRFVLREVYFDRNGLWAGMTARCGGPQRYFGMADLIFEKQRDWAGAGAPANVVAELGRLARQAGLSAEQFDACLQDNEKAKALVAEYQKNAEADGIEATPTFIINGKKYNNMNYARFSETLDGLLEN